jgi:allophanate hydrolase
MSQNMLRLAVCGLHLKGFPLNAQLTSLNAEFIKSCRSASVYKVYAFRDEAGKVKPGMIRQSPADDPQPGSSFYLELWDVPIENFGKFIVQVPPPLAIGTVELDDGSQVKGFVCEAWVAEASKQGADNATDITHHGSWPAYIESLTK